MKAFTAIFLPLFLIHACLSYSVEHTCDDLKALKNEFLNTIFDENADESLFHMTYSFKTVFFLKKL